MYVYTYIHIMCTYLCIYLSLSLYMYIYIYIERDIDIMSSCGRVQHDTAVCEINTHLDVVGVFNVPMPLPEFRIWRQDTPQQLTATSVYFTGWLHSLCPCPWTLTLGGMGGVRNWAHSRMSVYFTDTGRVRKLNGHPPWSCPQTYPCRLTHNIMYHNMLYYTII